MSTEVREELEAMAQELDQQIIEASDSADKLFGDAEDLTQELDSIKELMVELREKIAEMLTEGNDN